MKCYCEGNGQEYYSRAISKILKVSDNNWTEFELKDLIRIVYEIQDRYTWQENNTINILLDGKGILNCYRKYNQIDIEEVK